MFEKFAGRLPGQVRESNFSSELILNASNDGIIVTDGEGRVVFINRRGLEINDFSCEKVLGAPIVDILPMSGPLVMDCLRTGKPQLGYHVLGKKVRFVLNITLIRREGRVFGALGQFQEMQQFEQSARKLESYKQLNKQLETIFTSSSDGIVVYDGRGNFIRMNKADEKLNGWKLKDVQGKNVTQLQAEGWFDRSVSLEVLKTKRQVSMLQYVVRTQRHLLVTGTPAFDEEGNIAMVVLNERDLTQLNALREELEQARLITEKYKDELSQMSLAELKDQRIIAESDEMQETLRVALKLAQIKASNILILGESGTGKGLLARFIHQHRGRQKKPFIQINCAALPETLLEAELFGYEKGAFTGAREEGKAGLFELAQEGTLFLDEIGDLPFAVQAKLLKYLDDHVIMRLGGTKSIAVDCSVIAATNRDLETLAKKGEFRPDLYYRLNSFNIKVPPLRNRPADILGLMKYFLDKYNKEYGQERRLSAEALERLQRYPYPGNIRELKDIIRRAVALSDTEVLDPAFFSSIGVGETNPGRPIREGKGKKPSGSLGNQIVSMEKEVLREALLKLKTTRKVAEYLGTSQSSIVRKMKKYGLRQ